MGVESLERESQLVDPRTQVDDLVTTLVVTDGRPDFFDEHRAGDFDRDARDDGAAGVAHQAGDGALRGSDRGRKKQDDRQPDRVNDTTIHGVPPYGMPNP